MINIAIFTRSRTKSWLVLLGLLLCCASSIAYASDEAPYIDSKATKERFSSITAADMDLLRTKKILFTSRSFGLNLCNGLTSLAKKDAKSLSVNSDRLSPADQCARESE